MMQASTAPTIGIGHATGENRQAGTGIGRAIRTVYDALIRAQQARANVRVRPYLARESDQTLERLGFSTTEIQAIRASVSDRELPFI